MERRILLLQMAGLGYNFLVKSLGRVEFAGLAVRPIAGMFPGLTCPVQATMRTALLPSGHGIVGNGFFSSEQWRPLFWEQNSRLIEGPRIWNGFRRRGGIVGQLFIQQSLGPDADIVYSPAPIHRHHGGMIRDCIGQPPELCERLRKQLGVFPLQSRWGPPVSLRASRWIIRAITSVLRHEEPDLLYACIPYLDGQLQRYGPNSVTAHEACRRLDSMIQELLTEAQQEGYGSIVFGDYPITGATAVVSPNRTLRERGWLRARQVKGMWYPYFHGSQAFCVVDHQIAHVYVWNREVMDAVREALAGLEGVDRVLDGPAKAEAGVEHRRSGAMVLVAKPDYWFDYRWWQGRKEAPDYANRVDAHDKPGCDPCEFLFGRTLFQAARDPSRVRGTHGRLDEDEPVFYASDIEMQGRPQTLLELALSLETLLESVQPL
jgi:predicted AlkP superfamily pyrophosphatase or phosphodiesterase